MRLKASKISFRPSHLKVEKNPNRWQSICLAIGEVFWFAPSRLFDGLTPFVTHLVYCAVMIPLVIVLFVITRLIILALGLLGQLRYADGFDSPAPEKPPIR